MTYYTYPRLSNLSRELPRDYLSYLGVVMLPKGHQGVA